jgi:DNA-binding response OmpR family regulator
MIVFLDCDENREKFFRDILEADFALEALHARRLSEPENGDIVLVDLAERTDDWSGHLAELHRSLSDEVKVLAVLRFEQIRVLDGRAALHDFVSDGFTGEELRARLRLMSGVDETAGAEKGLEIDEERYEVRVEGTPVDLTFKEFELLRFLASRPGRVFTREVLLEQVWGYDYFGGARTVDVHIRRIRSKIEREGRIYIRTVRGVGYIFEKQLPQ